MLIRDPVQDVVYTFVHTVLYMHQLWRITSVRKNKPEQEVTFIFIL